MADAGITIVEPTSGDSLNPADYDYDLVIIGGGSGGIPLAKVDWKSWTSNLSLFSDAIIFIPCLFRLPSLRP